MVDFGTMMLNLDNELDKQDDVPEQEENWDVDILKKKFDIPVSRIKMGDILSNFPW